MKIWIGLHYSRTVYSHGLWCWTSGLNIKVSVCEALVDGSLLGGAKWPKCEADHISVFSGVVKMRHTLPRLSRYTSMT